MLVGVLGSVVTVLLYFLIVLVAIWGWYYWTHYQLIQEAGRLPCVLSRWPLLGNVLLTIGSLEKIGESAMKILTEAAARGFSTTALWLGPHPLVIVQGAEDVKKLLNNSNTLQKGYEEEEYAAEFIKYGLLTAPVDHWRITRRFMNPVFHPRNLEHLITIYNRNCQELVTNFEQYVNKGFVNIWRNVMDISMKNLCDLLFEPGIEIDTGLPEFKNLMDQIEVVPELMSARICKIWLRSDTVFNFLYRKELKELHTAFKEFTEIPLKAARERLNQKCENGEETIISKKDKNTKFSDVQTVVDAYSKLEQSYSQINEMHLHQELTNFFLTGTTSISTAVCSCLLSLAQHQDIQEKLYTEISSVLDKEREVTLQDLQNMPYLARVVKETNRRFTIIPYTSRRSTEEVKLSQCTLPAGTSIFVGIAGLLLDPHTYPDPLKFDPDRFIPENRTEEDKQSYIPFSAGSRDCIAKKYAEILMKLLTIHVLRRYHLTTNMDIQTYKRNFIIVLTSAEGYHIDFQRRMKKSVLRK